MDFFVVVRLPDFEVVERERLADDFDVVVLVVVFGFVVVGRRDGPSQTP